MVGKVLGIGDKLSQNRRCQGRRGDAETRGRGDGEEEPQFFDPLGLSIYRVFFSTQTPYMGVDKMHHPLTCHHWVLGIRC